MLVWNMSLLGGNKYCSDVFFSMLRWLNLFWSQQHGATSFLLTVFETRIRSQHWKRLAFGSPGIYRKKNTGGPQTSNTTGVTGSKLPEVWVTNSPAELGTTMVKAMEAAGKKWPNPVVGWRRLQKGSPGPWRLLWGECVFSGDSLWHDNSHGLIPFVGSYCYIGHSAKLPKMSCQKCCSLWWRRHLRLALCDRCATLSRPGGWLFAFGETVAKTLPPDKLVAKSILMPPPTQHLRDLALMLMYFLILKKASEDTGGKWKRRIR